MRTAATALVCVLLAGTSRAAEAGPPRPPAAAPVPVLLSHVVNAAPAGARFPGLYVSRADFAAEVAWLARHGYHAVTLTRVRDHWLLGRPLPAHPVVLS